MYNSYLAYPPSKYIVAPVFWSEDLCMRKGHILKPKGIQAGIGDISAKECWEKAVEAKSAAYEFDPVTHACVLFPGVPERFSQNSRAFLFGATSCGLGVFPKMPNVDKSIAAAKREALQLQADR